MEGALGAAAGALPEGEAFGAEAADDFVARQRSKIAERAQAPAMENGGELGGGIGGGEWKWREEAGDVGDVNDGSGRVWRTAGGVEGEKRGAGEAGGRRKAERGEFGDRRAASGEAFFRIDAGHIRGADAGRGVLEGG